MKKLLILDICDTLYTSNTTFDFLKFFSRNNKLLSNLLNLRKNIFLRILNKLSLKILKKDLIKILYIYYLRGKSEKEIKMLTLEFYEKILQNKFKIEVLKKLDNYKKEEFEIIIVSGTLDFIADLIAEKLNIDNYFATKLEIKNDLFTGKIQKDLLLEKEIIIKKILDKNKYEEIHLMTDNITDYNLVKYAKKAIIVLNDKNSCFWKKNIKNNIEFLESCNG